ncbi:3-oxoacyl-[acyl-carrier protein] reductase [Melghirimyces profundicolus]|uniref:3-oxoacyl-[acyl-carrier protein] reductase n=1 Tax=Melghirimyces profundicolus TaxID=1242148 RepID=A0A2T6BCA3_9BACL|nr:SDR family oxidoreductase [Melghirimyces profundicolus]PTX53711.1 3-oxoacyl-[acyl-carrier protein] reductase [Melghirimyces profundicolus]
MDSVFSSGALKGKTALVTGATGGIGREIAKRLRGMGANLVLTGRRGNVLKELKKELDTVEGFGDVVIVTADLTEETGRENVVRKASDSFGGTEILVNNAGAFASALLEEVKEEEMEWVMKVNFFSVVMLTQKVYEEMKRKKSGKIIQISSLSGIRGWEGGTLYASSKFAVNGFTQCLAVEAAKHGIQVNAVAPGFVETEMAREAIGAKAERAGRSLAEMWAQMEQGLPTGRLTTPEEVANAVAFLSTGAVDNMTGTYLRISGGGLLG